MFEAEYISLSELSHVQGKSQRHRGTRGGGVLMVGLI